MKNSKNIQQIYDAIRHLRELKRYTREYVADLLEISVSGYGKIERGEVDVSLSKLFKIAEILEVDVLQILNFTTSTIFDNPTSQELQAPVEGEANKKAPHEYLEKYIKLLESENERLKKM